MLKFNSLFIVQQQTMKNIF